MAFFSDGMPSVGEYLISPALSLAAGLNIAGNGVLFLGSPIPKWITASPRSRRMRASSFIFSVGDSAIDFANVLMLIRFSFRGMWGGGVSTEGLTRLQLGADDSIDYSVIGRRSQ